MENSPNSARWTVYQVHLSRAYIKTRIKIYGSAQIMEASIFTEMESSEASLAEMDCLMILFFRSWKTNKKTYGCPATRAFFQFLSRSSRILQQERSVRFIPIPMELP